MILLTMNLFRFKVDNEYTCRVFSSHNKKAVQIHTHLKIMTLNNPDNGRYCVNTFYI